MEKRAKFGWIAVLVMVTGLMALTQNCSEVSFQDAPSSNGSLKKCLEEEGVDCGGETSIALKKIQPAVAVRGISCLMCHAQIQANVITDFALGTPWYWGGAQAPGINDKSWFNNYVNTWQSTRTIAGSVYVPDEFVPRSVQDSMGNSFKALPDMKIVEVFNSPYKAPGPWDGLVGNEGEIAMSAKVGPPNGQAKVIPKSEIVIRSPSESEIEALAPALFASAESSGAVYAPSGAPVAGLTTMGIGANTYTVNTGSASLLCANADIVVKGTLYLKSLKVNASGGCRLYVSGTVFIEDAITYGTAPDQNLQITSANGIFMGIDLTNLNIRLADRRGLELSGSRSFLDRKAQVLAEATKIGTLKDAGPNGTRTSVNYSGLLLNAPLVHSRYLGEVKGAIIADAALFALGAFQFKFDPVFTRVPALPLLKKPILGVK